MPNLRWEGDGKYRGVMYVIFRVKDGFKARVGGEFLDPVYNTMEKAIESSFHRVLKKEIKRNP